MGNTDKANLTNERLDIGHKKLGTFKTRKNRNTDLTLRQSKQTQRQG